MAMAEFGQQMELPGREPPEFLGGIPTFTSNMSLPIHRWYRYSAGFSAAWVSDLIKRSKSQGATTVLDPFVGSGTVIIEAERNNAEAIGIEAHPFVSRLASSKLLWRHDPIMFREYAIDVLENARRVAGSCSLYSTLIQKCFSPHTLERLDAIRRALDSKESDSTNYHLTWVALVAILRECSSVGTAQWQYILPKKSKSKHSDPFQAFNSKIDAMSQDMIRRQLSSYGPVGKIVRGDARDCEFVDDGWADLVITSPPYANNYDYADATRLEMTFLGEIRSWGDLQDAVRKFLITSCSQHASATKEPLAPLLMDPLLEPIESELVGVVERLQSVRLEHGGKKNYHRMVAGYFRDMARVWRAIRRVTHNKSLVCFVIGDSAPYGVHVPVEKWFGKLAISAGFSSFEFEKLRDRNVKWKNRKHQVPLHEGLLWVKG